MAAADDASQQANQSGMDPRRLLVIFLLAMGIVLTLFFERVAALAFAELSIADPEVIEGLGWRRTTFLGLALAVAVVAAAGLVGRFRRHLLEVSTELMRVTWPTWSETRTNTIAVLIASAVAAIILFGIDSVAYKVMVEWLPKVWGSF